MHKCVILIYQTMQKSTKTHNEKNTDATSCDFLSALSAIDDTKIEV